MILSEVSDAPLEIDESTVTKLHILKVVEKFGSLPGENTAEEKERLSTVLNDLLGEPKVRALIALGNESSRRVAERLGMAYEMGTELYGKGINSYMRERT